MPRTNWKCIVPHSMVKALNLTKEHGKEKKNQSVQRIADRLGINGDLLYKWLGDAKMPVNKVIAFEEVCGINFVTQYLAHSQGFLLVPVPTGRKAKHRELNELQLFMTQVAALLIQSSDDGANTDPQKTMDSIKLLMEDLAFHLRNVPAADSPQATFNLDEA
jgi:hypothetical protein